MENYKYPVLLGVTALLGLFTIPVFGQDSKDDVFAVRTVVVAVSQGESTSVPGLGRGDFKVLERGIERDVVEVDATGLQPEIILLVDTSAGFVGQVPPLRRALESFVGAAAGSNKMTIYEFGGRPRILAGPTNDAAALMAAVKGIHIQRQEASYLLDAIVETAEGLGKSERAEGDEVHVVIVTGTGPEYSHNHRDRAKEVGARPDTVYRIVIYDSGSDQDFRRRGEIEDVLNHLKEETGGDLTRVIAATGLEGALESLATELRPTYRDLLFDRGLT